jgi:uncharacterized protein
MLFAVFFSDNPARADARQRLMSEHLAFLGEHSSSVRAAGPLRDPDSGENAGGLWLVEAESAEAVRQLYERDPFWPTGLRKSVRVLEWSQVFVSGRRMT